MNFYQAAIAGLTGLAALTAVIAAVLIIKRKNRKKALKENEKNKYIAVQENSEDAAGTEEQKKDDKQPPKAENLDVQIRFAFEHNILPSKLSADPIYIITAVIADKGAFLNNYYRTLYARQKQTLPYAAEEFDVSAPFDIAGAKAVKIEMPKKNLSAALCERIYIVYNNNFTKHLYITAEKTESEQLKMCMLIDGGHEEIGIIENNELEMLESIIKEEEIAEENYSDVLEKLMSGAKPAEPLLTDPAEIAKYSSVFMNALMQVQKFKQENKRDEALKLIKEVIKKEAVKYEDTDLTEHHSFRNSFEVLLYANLHHPYNPEKQQKKQLVGMQVDLASAYLVYGVMMLEQKQFDKAIDILWEGLRINPVNTQLMFALADAYKGKKFLKSYCCITARAHVCAVRKADISRIYKNFAYYYTQIKEYKTAAALIYASKYFDVQGFTSSLRGLEETAGQKFPEIPLDEIKSILWSNGIAWGAKELAVSVVSLLDKEFTQKQNQQGMKMCRDLKNELTLDLQDKE